MHRHRSVLITLFLTALCLIGLGSTPMVAPAFGKKKKKKKKKRLSKHQWKKIMNRWARELKVKCDYCHVKEGEVFDYKASTPKKEIAHYCEENFVEKLRDQRKRAISCQTCHKGKTKFLPRQESKTGKK